MLYGLAGAGMLGHGLFRPILPIFARRLGATGVEVGLLTSGFMLARAITAYVMGKNADRTGRRTIYVRIGFFCVFMIAFGYFFIDSYFGLLFLRFCQGICSGLMWPATQIIVVEQADKTYRTRALSLYQITGRIGGLLSRAVLGIILIVTARIGLSELSSFRVIFIIGAIILIGGFIDTLFVPEYKKAPRIEKKGKPPYSIFLLGFVFGANVLTIVAMYGSSHLTDSIGIKRSLWFVIIPCFAAALLLPFVRVFIIFVVIYFMLRMSISSFVPISRAYATNISTEVGSNIGTLNMLTNLGAVVGPIIGGFIYDYFTQGFKIAGYSVIALLLIPGIFVLLRKK
jgi:MFS family permease